MSVTQAKNNYIGIGGCKRMNCAQSIIGAFKEKFNIEDALIESFKEYGSGRAPSGLCGAYYAARYILDNNKKEDMNKFEQYFIEQAGSLNCINIKNLKKLSCVGCVEKCSEFLEKIG